MEPKASAIHLDDIIYGLSYKFRYGGQIGPITVAEHSVLVSQIIDILWPESGVALAGLLHDACEAYTHDIQAPVRKFIKVVMKNGDIITWGDLERRINLAVSKALSDGTDFYTYPEVQAADVIALALEKAAMPSITNDNWGIPTIPEAVAHLKVQFLPSDIAALAFIARFNELKATSAA